MNFFRSDIEYGVGNVFGKDVLWILDLDLGGKSVTNNIEILANKLCFMMRLDPKECLIVYQDTERHWDGWDAKEGRYVHLHEKQLTRAVVKLHTLLNKKA